MPDPVQLHPSGTAGASDLLAEAITAGASDLHLDPTDDGWRARLRIDGRFDSWRLLDHASGSRVIGRLKVLAGLMVYRADLPQEGRLELANGVEARLAIIPTPSGEKATVRIFDNAASRSDLSQLGFDEQTHAAFESMLSRDSGLVLVVGPSGSGKTTTLYAALQTIARKRGDFAQICSIEDPVERRIPDCTQVQVDPSRQLSFVEGLKFLLRQDPEVVMVGEIRDAETAAVAVRAAMTGHLVLATLHCGRASEAAPRLLEMGAPDYGIEIALTGVIAQRLVRLKHQACGGRGCTDCGDGSQGRSLLTEWIDYGKGLEGPSFEKAAERAIADGRCDPEEIARVLGRER